MAIGIARPQTTSQDQAASLRHLAGRVAQPHHAQTIAVTSGKGGVGKTNVAVNLAVCLAAARRRVTLVDLDAGLANADLLLNVQPRYNLAHVLAGTRDVLDVAVGAPGGIRFVAGGSGDRALANMGGLERSRLIHRMKTLEQISDVIVYDCGAGISRNVLDFAMSADVVTVVSTPEPTSVTDAYAMVKVLVSEAFHGRLQLLVNMARGRAEARDVYDRLAHVSERFLNFRLADAGFVLQDEAVELAVRKRTPIVLVRPRCPSSLCMTALAARMVRTGVVADAGSSGSWMARFVGLFA